MIDKTICMNVFLTFPLGGGLPVSLCDYLFPGDTCADACQSAKELLGLKIRKEHVDDSQETLAGEDKCVCWCLFLECCVLITY